MTYKSSLSYVGLEADDERAVELLKTAKSNVGFVPNMYAEMANAPGLLDSYLYGYERFRNESGFSPAEQEVVFLSISLENGCDYCMAAHSTLADNVSKVPPAVTDAIREDRKIPDARLRALSTFTRAMVVKRGRPSEADVKAFVDAGYSERAVLQVILAIGVKTLSNYSNHVFETSVDEAFKGRLWRKDAA